MVTCRDPHLEAFRLRHRAQQIGGRSARNWAQGAGDCGIEAMPCAAIPQGSGIDLDICLEKMHVRVTLKQKQTNRMLLPGAQAVG